MVIKAVDLFCGAGGLTRGLLDAGIDVVAGFDVDAACAYPYEKNNHTKFIQQDLAQPDILTIKKLLAGPNLKLIAGCAPCQSFSTYNRNRSKDTRSWPLLDSFGKIVSEIKPDFVTMENVAGIERDRAFDRFFRKLEGLGYSVAYDVLDCRNFGMAQQRRRLVLIASRGRRPFDLPEGFVKDPAKFATVRKLLGRLPPVDSGGSDKRDPLHCASRVSALNLQRLKVSVPGGTWRDWPKELRAKCHTKVSGDGYVSVYGRMEWDKPSPTITGQCYGFGNGRFGHPEQHRALTLREAALLQSFPRSYRFCADDERVSFKKIGLMIGNAVPPALGRAIGRSIVAAAKQR